MPIQPGNQRAVTGVLVLGKVNWPSCGLWIGNLDYSPSLPGFIMFLGSRLRFSERITS